MSLFQINHFSHLFHKELFYVVDVFLHARSNSELSLLEPASYF